jgi:hypothetical protein
LIDSASENFLLPLLDPPFVVTRGGSYRRRKGAAAPSKGATTTRKEPRTVAAVGAMSTKEQNLDN